MPNPITPISSLERKEELANSLTHGAGILFAVVAIPFLLLLSLRHLSVFETVIVALYAFSFLLVFTVSTAYHCVFEKETKKVLRIIDHISIYFLIAGSYTPFVFLYSQSMRGTLVLSSLWILTFVGIIFKTFFVNRFEMFSIGVYLLMGWSVIFMPSSFFENIPQHVWNLILAGGILYTAGVGFYVWQKLKFHHAIWHVFVLIGAICHFVGVGFAVVG